MLNEIGMRVTASARYRNESSEDDVVRVTLDRRSGSIRASEALGLGFELLETLGYAGAEEINVKVEYADESE